VAALPPVGAHALRPSFGALFSPAYAWPTVLLTLAYFAQIMVLDELMQLAGGELESKTSEPSQDLLDQLPDLVREVVQSMSEPRPKRRH